MRIRIASGLLDQIIAHAGNEPAREVCGLLFGDFDTITAAIATANVALDPSRRFEVDPQALFAAMRAERNGGPRLIGHYHSHPSGLAEPSARDAADAEPGRLWLIVAGDEAQLWRAESGGGFGSVALDPC